MKTYKSEAFKRVYGSKNWYALILNDKREPVVRRSTINLYAKCGNCSNCSGVECATVTVLNKKEANATTKRHS